MAAYAALVSLMNTITVSMERTPHDSNPRISFDDRLIKPLQERVNFLVEFLEGGWKGSQHLEGQIADLAYAAEDAIESNMVDQVLSGFTCIGQRSSIVICSVLKKIILDMDSIKKEAVQIKDMSAINAMGKGIPRSSSSTAFRYNENKEMMGCDSEKYEIMERLTGQRYSLQVISIVGMGGIGKTTLARNVYDDAYVIHYFDVRVWITVSQEYNAREILIGVLFGITQKHNNESLEDFSNKMSPKSDATIGEQIHKSLSGMRYLVVMDDIWSINVWNEIKMFFPDNKNGWRILVTTRMSNVANQFGTYRLSMKFLTKDASWNLLRAKVFGEDCCPHGLQISGKKIAENCRGLPLAIAVIGGVLAKSDMTPEYWEHVAEDVTSAICLNDNEHCLKVLSLSYDYLPIYLKPCFLYMGVFPEDHGIHVSELTKLWVAEGFLKPVSGRTLEEIAETALTELVERNLIVVSKWGSSGKIKSCTMHDLLRELCLRRAQNERFLYPVRKLDDVPPSLDCQRRIVINQKVSKQTLPSGP